MAEQLTLEALGVDRAELARRMTAQQEALGRDDATCAELAGVKADRWRAWREGVELPGVARMPKIAHALATIPQALMFGIGADVEQKADGLQQGREAARFALELADLTDSIVRLSARVNEAGALLVNGGMCGNLLVQAGRGFIRARAVLATPDER
jgi:hypothetical protein